jgi:hypothetical protein
MRIQAFAMGLALALATVGVARADDFLFTISGGDKTTTFELSPTSGEDEGIFFFFPSVSAVVGGSPVTIASLTFWSKGLNGGFVADGLFNFMTSYQFYSESSPTFLPGVYMGLLNSDTGKTDTVTVKDLPTTVSEPPPTIISDPPPVTDPPDPPATAVPELSTWAMLLLGFLSLGYAGYRKARTRTIN